MIDLSGMPAPRGIYYHASGGWVALSPTVLMPLWNERPVALEILNVGSDHTVTRLPGRHSGIQIASDARPTFYLHGISPSDLYLVRAASKTYNREVRMPTSRHFWEWAHFEDKDLSDFDVVGVNGDIVAIQPSSALKPGEYALSATFQPGQYWIRLGFDFGIAGAASIP
jgi:hypothetical protein